MKKINIRERVFETNSSSTHSICIPEDFSAELLDVLTPDEDGILRIYGEDFESYGTCNSALSKTNYLAIYAKNSNELQNNLKEALKKQTGCDDVEFDVSDDYYLDAYEDFQWVFESSDVLISFIFNKEADISFSYDG